MGENFLPALLLLSLARACTSVRCLPACSPARNFRFRHERVQIKVESTLTLMAVAGHVIDGS